MSIVPRHGRCGPFRAALAGLALLFTVGTAVAETPMERAPICEAAAPAASRYGVTAPARPEARAPRPNFPIITRRGRRHLIDADGRPFLIHGDAAWSMIAELNRQEVNTYLAARRAAGFNTVLVSLIEHKFANGAPNNAYGEPPFLTPGDYSTPNELYFAHADWVIHRAARAGFLVILTPSYLGFGGGDEGWYGEMALNGRDKLYEYGRFLGTRYRRFRNILWLNGGDYDPPDKDLVRAIAEGIRATSPRALQSVGGGPDTAAFDDWADEPWIDINTVYTYGPVHPEVLRQYQAHPEPVILLESMYENEQSADAARLRTQAYHAVLSGAAGHVFGNNPMWHFDGPGIYATTTTWQEELDSPGTVSMTHLWSLLSAVKWWRLIPDADNLLLRADLQTGLNEAVAASTSDGSLAIVYMPTARPIDIDLGRLADRPVRARWYDPSTGLCSSAGPPDLTATGIRTFTPPPTNGTGFSDWVLLLQSGK